MATGLALNGTAMSDTKAAIKKLGIVNKYLNFQVSVGNVPNITAKEIKKYVKEAVDLLHEEKKVETQL